MLIIFNIFVLYFMVVLFFVEFWKKNIEIFNIVLIYFMLYEYFIYLLIGIFFIKLFDLKLFKK